MVEVLFEVDQKGRLQKEFILQMPTSPTVSHSLGQYIQEGRRNIFNSYQSG